jgi:outer membrane protein insertion porin family
MSALVLALALFFQLAAPPTPPIVRYVRFQCDAAFPLEEARLAVLVEEGKPLRLLDVQRSLQNLHLLGQFRSIRAVEHPFEDGVMVSFVLERARLIRSVSVQRTTPWRERLAFLGMSVPKSEIVAATRLQPMDPLEESRLRAAERRVRELLQRNGFPDAEVTLVQKRDAPRRFVDVVVRIDEGLPYLVASVTFAGQPQLRPEVLRRSLETRVGRPFSAERLDRDRERLLELYRFYGYYIDRIPRPLVQTDREQRTVEVRFDLDIPPRTRFELEYPLHLWNLDWITYRLDRNRLDEILGLDQLALDEEALAAARENLAHHFRTRGYARATVALETETDPLGETVQHLRVEAGPLIRVGSITISGNRALPEETIRRQMLTRVGRKFRPDVFQSDLEAVLTLYRSEGFPEARIVEQEVRYDEAGQAHVQLTIEEGPRRIVGEVAVQGNRALSSELIHSRLLVAAGNPLDQGLINRDVQKIRNMYEIRGYPAAEVQPELTETPDETVQVTYVIDEGAPSRFGKVLIRGYFRTKRKVIDRVNRVDEGEPYSYQRLLESQRNVAALGIFRAVRFEPLSWEAGQPERTVVLTVTEKKNSYFDLGFGYNTEERWRMIFELGTANFQGYQRSLSAAVLLSGVERRIGLRFREPSFANAPIELTGELFDHRRQKTGYEVFRQGGRVSLKHALTRELRLLLEYRLESQEVQRHDPGILIDERDRRHARVAALGPLIMYDSRDDPRNPGKGMLASLRVETAQKYFGSQLRFPKAEGQVSVFLPLLRNSVLALSARTGLARNLPLAESFFVGGVKTVRGFRFESIRPHRTVWDMEGNKAQVDVPANAKLILNAEARFPTIWDLQGVIFWDAGNAWESTAELDARHLRQSVGAGLRFMAPFGPIGFDMAFNLHPRPGESGARGELMIGHAF